MALLNVEHLTVSFHTRNGVVRAVRDVSFQLDAGQTLGIVGESGCGKSVTCYSLMGLLPKPPAVIEKGRAVFEDRIDLLACKPKALRAIRGQSISMIFQDPMTALNPYLRISTQLMEPLRIHQSLSEKQALTQAIEMLEKVGMPDASRRIHCHPHEFSGGMRQRVMIAMALITKPKLLIADEPTTALDVTVQAQIMELIRAQQQELGMAVILITHDLGVVAGFCENVQVMYAGQIVEAGDADHLFYHSAHPYTRALQQSIPSLQEKGVPLYTIPGMPPDLSRPIAGCPFAARCPHVLEACRHQFQHLESLNAQHQTACLRYQAESGLQRIES
jgi:oligopeptide transport system ATP-binding protein